MSTLSLDLHQPQKFLFCKVEFYLQCHYIHHVQNYIMQNPWTVYYRWSIVKFEISLGLQLQAAAL